MQPDVNWYLNLGDDDTPVWQEVTDTLYFYFTGPDTTTKQDHITPPTFQERKWAEELWIAETNFANSSQCKIFVAPTSKKQSTNVLKITFSNDSASSIRLSAYDNSSCNSTDEQMFNGYPWLKAIETSDDTQPSQNWINYMDMTSNGSTSNSLKSSNNYVECSANVTVDGSKTFVLACMLPSNATTLEHPWNYCVNYDYSSA